MLKIICFRNFPEIGHCGIHVHNVQLGFKFNPLFSWIWTFRISNEKWRRRKDIFNLGRVNFSGFVMQC